MNTLSKEERIKSRKEIELLFSEGKRLKNKYLQLIYCRYDHTATCSVKISFSVPKKKIPLATNRNRIKRIMREVYRHHKPEFLPDFEKNHFLMMLIYNVNEEISYHALKDSYNDLMLKFKELIGFDT